MNRLICVPSQERGFGNVRVITGDINEFDLAVEDGKGSFDRVMSIEMFEHMKNYKLLIAKISDWLAPGGKLFGEYLVDVGGERYEITGAWPWLLPVGAGGVQPRGVVGGCALVCKRLEIGSRGHDSTRSLVWYPVV